MVNYRFIHFLRILTENENLTNKNSPFKFAISPKTTKAILNVFSINLIGKIHIDRHFENKSTFFRVSTNYTYKNSEKFKKYILTVELRANIKIKASELEKYLKEYFYLKLIFIILFKGEGMVAKELVELIKHD